MDLKGRYLNFMKSRIILAVVLVLLASVAITVELIYLKKTSDALCKSIDRITESISKESFEEALSLYKDFSDEFIRKENTISVFIHDKAVDEIRDLIYETDAYFLKRNTSEFFENEDLIRNLEKIKIKIHDIYVSMIPDLKNLM